MIRILLAGLCLLATASFGQARGVKAADFQWVLPGAAFDCDFENGRRYNCAQDQAFTITRTASKYCQWLDGTWTSFPANTACITNKGFLIEPSRTNRSLWSRDFTNAAWAKVNVTAALTATGIDTNANSASLLTATVGNGTILQTITLGSNTDTYSVFLQRVTGAGTINVSGDGLAWTACTVTDTVGWTRCTVTASLINPVFGIQIATNGDQINADFSQLEVGSYASSPILTTSSNVTRDTDIVNFALAANLTAIAPSSGAVIIKATVNNAANNDVLVMWNVGNGYFFRESSASTVDARMGAPAAITATIGNSLLFGTDTIKMGVGWDPTGFSIGAAGGTVATSSNAPSASAITASIGPGSPPQAVGTMYVHRVTVWNVRVPDADIQAMTAP